MNRFAGLFLAFAVSLAAIPTPAAAQDKSLTVFAAASMKNALDDIDAAYTAKTGVKITVSYAASSALAKQIEQGATADVKSVPAGKYAKASLEKLGAWTAAEPKFAMTENVRAALALVARGEAAFGIVYSTDARVEPGVKIVGTFPADSHPAIIYPVAATTTAKTEATDYLAFLRSSAAKAIFEKYGFSFLVSPTT